MALFESILLLATLAVLLLQLSRRLDIPYPTMLAGAGAAVAALPFAPEVEIDPQLMLALFVAPALLDAAYDFPLRALRQQWLPLISLAALAVGLTTAAVAWIGVALAGLPVAAAIALGAIVAPPDAAAASAVLSRFRLPRRTVLVLEGESLFNDAVALLIFSVAVGAAGFASGHVGTLPHLALAAPGGVLVGYALGRIYLAIRRFIAGTLGGTVFEFVSTFGVWILAERLGLSAILAVVAYAMTLARCVPVLQSARDRVHSYAVWDTVVFLLNVLAFLLLGLEARTIVLDLEPGELARAIGFAAAVLATTILVRIAWVLLYNRGVNLAFRMIGRSGAPTLRQGIVVSWCGMRGLVTLATALALPVAFPGRDLIVLAALAVVLGTLVLQGLTLGPLVSLLRFPPDESLTEELGAARLRLVDAAAAALEGRTDEASVRQLDLYRAERAVAAEGTAELDAAAKDVRRVAIAAKRRELARMRRAGEVEDDVFYALTEELDWAELAATPRGDREIVAS